MAGTEIRGLSIESMEASGQGIFLLGFHAQLIEQSDVGTQIQALSATLHEGNEVDIGRRNPVFQGQELYRFKNFQGKRL